MKKLFCFLFVLLFIASGCNKEINTPNRESDKENRIEEQLKEMSLEEKIGQMLIVSYEGTSVTEELFSLLNQVKPGGFILFSNNFSDYEQTQKLIADIKSTSEIPMFISIDQEGGRVQRIKNLSDQEVTIIPPMYEIGLTRDEDFAYQVGKVIGEELRVFDINMDFAPVLDIYSNPNNTVIGDRSFGTTSDIVSTMAISLASGLQDTGVISVYKHFPGHGDTLEDSHDTLPIVTKTKEELMNFELIPFIQAIENGAEAIMVGHIAVPSITKDNTPATLSKVLIQDLLKDELGFQGLVITDGLNMKSLTNLYSQEEIYINAILAGVDILLMPEFSLNTIEIIKNAVLNGEISEERIDDAVTKILTLKYKRLSDDNPYTREYLASTNHKKIVFKIKSAN